MCTDKCSFFKMKPKIFVSHISTEVMIVSFNSDTKLW